ncbi:glycosyltransferase family 2 protein [Aquirufa antheringensis]
MNICLIVINYNGLEFLKKYLLNLDKGCIDNGIDLYVTDDRSKDNSVNFLVENNIKYFISERVNKGFASNVNNGILCSKDIKPYDYFLIANNDIETDKFFFENLSNLVNRLVFEQNIGIVGFKEVVVNSNNFAVYSTKAIDLNFRDVNSIPGFFFLISNTLIDKIGLFDEEYFMYGEDNDYFFRTIKSGFRIISTDIPVLHFSEGSSVNSKLTSWYIYRNFLLFTVKNKGFFGFIKAILKLVYYIFIPFTKNTSPSVLRIRRNGFLYNNYLLFKSILWNIKYFLKNKI